MSATRTPHLLSLPNTRDGGGATRVKGNNNRGNCNHGHNQKKDDDKLESKSKAQSHSRRRSSRTIRPSPPATPSFSFTVTGTEDEHDHDHDDHSSEDSHSHTHAHGSNCDNITRQTITITHGFSSNRLSPIIADAPRRSKMAENAKMGESAPASPTNATSHSFKNPFNFETQIISAGPAKPKVGQRRGHKYKHSSVSAQHQIFLEPTPRPPPVLPASLPVPTLLEAYKSLHKDQLHRLLWCLIHVSIALYVFLSSNGSLAVTALSHLVFFDAASGLVTIGVDVLGNFEAWRRSSVRHPFGLERGEVLAGFAMSVFLIFGGFDLCSHDLKHLLEGMGGHHVASAYTVADALAAGGATSAARGAAGAGAAVGAAGAAGAGAVLAGAELGDVPVVTVDEILGHGGGHSHTLQRATVGNIDFAALAAVLATLVSAYGMKNQARISRLLRVGYLSSLPSSVLRNPFHFLTLLFSGILLLVPLLGLGEVKVLAWVDRVVCAAIAAAMFGLGGRMAVAQGLMCLMSYSDYKGAPVSVVAAARGAHGAGVEGREGEKERELVRGLKRHSTASLNPLDGKDGIGALSTGGGGIGGGKAAGGGVSAVVKEIESEGSVLRVDEAQFWQVHYGLGMANMKLCVSRGGSDDASLTRLRQRIVGLVQSRLGEGYGRGGGLRWDVSVETCVEE